MYVAEVSVRSRAGGEAEGERTLGVVADFGPAAALFDGSAAHARPALADAPLENATDVAGRLAILRRGGVPLVEKVRRAQEAGAAAALVINADDTPLLAHAHAHGDGRVDMGDDIAIPMLVVPLSAERLLQEGSAVSFAYNAATEQPLSAEEYSAQLRTVRGSVPEGVPSPSSRTQSAPGSPGNDSVVGMEQRLRQEMVQEEWSLELLAQARQRAEEELAEMRSRLSGVDAGAAEPAADRQPAPKPLPEAASISSIGDGAESIGVALRHREAEAALRRQLDEERQRSQALSAALKDEKAKSESATGAMAELQSTVAGLQEDNQSREGALLAAQQSAVLLETTRAEIDARYERQLAAAEQTVAEHEEARQQAERSLEQMRTDLQAQLEAAMDASKVALADVQKMQKEDEERLQAAMSQIDAGEVASREHVAARLQAEHERDAAKAALEDVQKAQKEGEAGLAAATSQLQAGEVATREHAAARQQAEHERDAAKAAEGRAKAAEAAAKLQAEEAAAAAQKRYEQAQELASMKLASAEAEGARVAEGLRKSLQTTELALQETKEALAVSEQANAEQRSRLSQQSEELSAVRAEASAAAAAARATAEEQQHAAEQIRQQREEASAAELSQVREQMEAEASSRVAQAEAQATATMADKLREINAAHELAISELSSVAETAKAASLAAEAKHAVDSAALQAQLREVERETEEQVAQLRAGEAKLLESTRQHAKQEVAEVMRSTAVNAGRLETMLDAERQTHHACAAKLDECEGQLAGATRELAALRTQLERAETAREIAETEMRLQQESAAAAQQRENLLAASAEERGRAAEDRTRSVQDQLREMQTELAGASASSRQRQSRGDAELEKAEATVQQMAEEMAQLRSELTETREAMLWVQIDASAKVAGQGLEMESEMQEAAESHTRRLVELEAELRAKFDTDLEEQVRALRTSQAGLSAESKSAQERAQAAEEKIQAMQKQSGQSEAAMQLRLREAETALSDTTLVVERAKASEAAALDESRRLGAEVTELHESLAATREAMLAVQVEATGRVESAERGWRELVEQADARAAEAVEKAAVAGEVAAQEAKAHATLLATLAKPMIWSKQDGRLVRQTRTDVQGLE